MQYGIFTCDEKLTKWPA